jgi:hypothetical protein
VTLELPIISEGKIKYWIGKIYDLGLTEIPNEWYKNIYGPVDGEAGCYYELKRGKNKLGYRHLLLMLK